MKRKGTRQNVSLDYFAADQSSRQGYDLAGTAASTNR